MRCGPPTSWSWAVAADVPAGRARLLEVVEQSPAAAARHDRAGWVNLFTPDGAVEDPVGSRPHVGHEALGRFFDTFIAPRDIAFHRDVDIVTDDSVVRDLTLGITMSPKVSLAVPALLHYTLREVDGTVRIARLQAYWELPAMMGRFLATGPAAAPVGLALTRALLTNQGLSGTVGFARGVPAPRRRQRRRLEDVLTALSTGDEVTLHRLLGHARLPADFADLRTRFQGAHWGRVLSAGRSATATVYPAAGANVLIADFTSRGEVERLRVF
jgi:hypothetical protein